MHSDVMGLVAGGHSGAEILAAFKAVYGEKVLMAPVRSGFNLIGYTMPFIVLVLCVSLLASPSANDFFQFWWSGHLIVTNRSPYDPDAWAALWRNNVVDRMLGRLGSLEDEIRTMLQQLGADPSSELVTELADRR